MTSCSGSFPEKAGIGKLALQFIISAFDEIPGHYSGSGMGNCGSNLKPDPLYHAGCV